MFKYKYIIGLAYIAYALIKIAVGISVYVLSPEQIKEYPIINIFAKESEDKTLAGRFYEYMFLIFGVYSLFEGLSILEQLPKQVAHFFESKYTQYSVFSFIGISLVFFYSLVLYTDIPISKKQIHYEHYKILGLYYGISFLIMPIIWELTSFFMPLFNKLAFETRSEIIIGSVILFFIAGDFIYGYLKSNEDIIQTIEQQPNVKLAMSIEQQIMPIVSVYNKSK